jgi:glycosyltransferase involved in cell wall biosynthesis
MPDKPPFKKISILIPVYNEVRFLTTLLEKVETVDFCGLQKEIILVDDGSQDGTRDLLPPYESNPLYKVVYHPHNMGKGAALRTAIQHADGDILAIQDADLEYDPKDYPELIQLILDGKADVVYGSRLTAGKAVRAFNVLHYFGNKFLTLITNILYNTTLTDMETCYKAFRADVIKPITIRSNRFDFEPEITAKVLKQGARLYEAPISYSGRNFDEGKKITWRDGIVAVWTLLKYRFVD